MCALCANIFDHIDIKKENIHIPDGTLEKEDVRDYCIAYEEKIKKSGGIDIQVLGIGRTGILDLMNQVLHRQQDQNGQDRQGYKA